MFLRRFERRKSGKPYTYWAWAERTRDFGDVWLAWGLWRPHGPTRRDWMPPPPHARTSRLTFCHRRPRTTSTPPITRLWGKGDLPPATCD